MVNYRLWPIPKSHAETQISGPRNVLFTICLLRMHFLKMKHRSLLAVPPARDSRFPARILQNSTLQTWQYFDPNVVKPTIKEQSKNPSLGNKIYYIACSVTLEMPTLGQLGFNHYPIDGSSGLQSPADTTATNCAPPRRSGEPWISGHCLAHCLNGWMDGKNSGKYANC